MLAENDELAVIFLLIRNLSSIAQDNFTLSILPNAVNLVAPAASGVWMRVTPLMAGWDGLIVAKFNSVKVVSSLLPHKLCRTDLLEGCTRPMV
jgi:hypothetical protein